MLTVSAFFSDGRPAGSIQIKVMKPSKLCLQLYGCHLTVDLDTFVAMSSYFPFPFYDPVLDTFMALDLLL